MKIVGMKFKNINSLQGEWEIRFDRPPLADTGLFAIVGPNGSGKTSILDALTLALYGETPRMKDPEAGVMNWESTDSYAEVTFSVGGNLYRSRWSVQKHAGELQTPEMMIASLNGQETLLEDRVIKVRNRVAELTGLDFKRFCRSMLLAQNEFTAFLNALENERSEILEKIMGPELIRELQESLRTQIQAEHDKLLQLKEAAHNYPILNSDLADALKERFQQAEDALGSTQRLLNELANQEKWHNRLHALELERDDSIEALTNAESALARIQADVELLDQSQPAKPFQNDIARMESLQAETERTGALVTLLQGDIQSYREQMGELERRLQESHKKTDQAKMLLDEHSEIVQRARELDSSLGEENTRFLDSVSRYETLEHSLKEMEQQYSELEQEASQTENRLQEFLLRLEQHAVDNRLGTDLPVIEETLTRSLESRRRLDEHKPQLAAAQKAEQHTAQLLTRAEKALDKAHQKVEKAVSLRREREARMESLLGTMTPKSLSTHYHDKKSTLKSTTKLEKIALKYHEATGGRNLHDALAQAQLKQDALGRSLAEEEACLAHQEKKVAWLEALKQYAEDRSLLQPGEPCPLCGSLDHPLTDQEHVHMEEDAARELQARQNKVTALRTQMEALNAEVGALHPLIQAMEALRDSWAKTGSPLNNEWDIADLPGIRREVETQKAEVKEYQSFLRTVRWQKWRSSWTKQSLRWKERKLAGKERKKEQLKDVHEERLSAVSDLQARVKDLELEERTVQDELDSLLRSYGETCPAPGKEPELIERLNERLSFYRFQVQERQALERRGKFLEERRNVLPEEMERQRGELGTLAAEIEALQMKLSELKSAREELAESGDPIQESLEAEREMELGAQERSALTQEIEVVRQALVDREQDLTSATDEAEKALRLFDAAQLEIMERALPAGFHSMGELRSAFELLERQDSLEAQWSAAQKALTEAKARCDAAHVALETAASAGIAVEQPQTLSERIALLTKQAEPLREEFEAAHRALRQYQEQELEYREFMKLVAQQEKVWARAVDEEKALSSKDSLLIKKELQHLMLQRLLHRANRYMETLSGRYRLQPVDEEGLGLQIEDALQGGKFRATDTLSGGESFVASVCLALGLADLASRDRKLESLFLDEGFGTLDDETLYRVMATLKELQADGRTVGIISHVKRLADEIPTQIRVEKLPGGCSRVSVVA